LIQEIFVNNHHFFTSPRRLATFAAPLVWAGGLWASVALAQPAPTPPVAPRMTQAAPAGFQSALEGYRPYTDDKVLNWKAANDTTAQIGGWRAYAKEASQSEGTMPAHDMSKMPESKSGGNKP
jgi:hypothetical protein